MHFTLNKRVLRERLLALFSTPNAAPLLVFGNQKSGTSAIAGLLAQATGNHLITDFAGAQEPYIGELIRGDIPIANYVRRNAWAFSAPIVKEPGLTFAAPALMAHFRKSRAVTVLRNPWQNIRSILERVDIGGDADRLAPGRRRLNRTWRSILVGSDLGLAPGHYIDILAQRWLKAAQIAETLGERTLIIRYEDFSRHKRATIETLARNLGLPVVADISEKLDHQFQPRGHGADPKAFFGQNYARITAICGAEAARLGYEG
ncbi:MAG: hypothetical protein JSR55_12720 [Proteobacteria bacterium]|nr:hypothetical protein [Pseudomonadota bacterium]